MPREPRQTVRTPLSGVAVGLVVGLWAAGVTGGFAAWMRYDATPGAAAAGESPAPAAGDRAWVLTLFAHPHCPCLRASLAELAGLQPADGGLGIEVVFVRPPGAEPGWERTELWVQAAGLPGVTVRSDPDGAEAARVGARTSGYAVLTDRSGRVVFRGGLTRARGQVGGSDGGRAVRAALAGEQGVGEAPVFGCPLFDDPR